MNRHAGREYPAKEVGAVIDAALRDARKAKPSRRHPAEVTSDRLGDAVSRWGDLLTGKEKDMIAQLRDAFEEIAEGRRERA